MKLIRKIIELINNIINKKNNEKITVSNIPQLNSTQNVFRENLKTNEIDNKIYKKEIEIMKCNGDGTGIQKLTS